jgi:hypothetical protein
VSHPLRVSTVFERLSTEDLLSAPELASLALLEAALGVAILAVAAACPDLNDPDVEFLVDEPAQAAFDVVERARVLGASLNRYRLAVVAAQQREVDMPF